MARSPQRSWFAPEVIQSSTMDCGPAALKCMLDGFGLQVQYGRLREACQTEIDGTSISSIELVGRQYGLWTQQVLVPFEHLWIHAVDRLPGVVVVRLPTGGLHFSVLWRRSFGRIQVMDPATGRRWLSPRQLREQLYEHEESLPLATWRRWIAAPANASVLERRLGDLGIGDERSREWIATADEDLGWFGWGSLDAAVRMVTMLVDGGGLRRGQQAERTIRHLIDTVATAEEAR